MLDRLPLFANVIEKSRECIFRDGFSLDEAEPVDEAGIRNDFDRMVSKSKLLLEDDSLYCEKKEALIDNLRNTAFYLHNVSDFIFPYSYKSVQPIKNSLDNSESEEAEL